VGTGLGTTTLIWAHELAWQEHKSPISSVFLLVGLVLIIIALAGKVPWKITLGDFGVEMSQPHRPITASSAPVDAHVQKVLPAAPQHP
jgi:hypothetical protein